MINTLLFDYGGVIAREGSQKKWVEENYEKYRKTPEEVWDIILAEWDLAKVNDIPSSHYWENIGKKLNADPMEVRTSIAASFSINPGTVDLLKEFVGKYTLVLFSNQIEDWLEEILDQNDLRKYFDYNLSSYIARMAKPDPEYFRYVMREVDCNADDMVLIDDKSANIESAKSLGIEGIQFHDIEQTRSDLKSLGILT